METSSPNPVLDMDSFEDGMKCINCLPAQMYIILYENSGVPEALSIPFIGSKLGNIL